MRYVVLHHTGCEAPHFDLLLAIDDTGPLLSWRFRHWPPSENDRVEARPPHRRLYLEFEGELSGNRGVVKRMESGKADWLHPTEGKNGILSVGPLQVRLPLPDATAAAPRSDDAV